MYSNIIVSYMGDRNEFMEQHTDVTIPYMFLVFKKTVKFLTQLISYTPDRIGVFDQGRFL